MDLPVFVIGKENSTIVAVLRNMMRITNGYDACNFRHGADNTIKNMD